MECALKPVTDPVAETARAAAQALAAIEAPLLALSRHLEDILDDEAAELDGSQRSRIEGALRGLDRRARMTLPGWRSMLAALEDGGDQPDPDFVDWLSAETAFGRIHDVALRPPLDRPDRPAGGRRDRAVARGAGDIGHPVRSLAG